MATATTPLNYQSSTDPKKVAANNRLLIAQQGNSLIDQSKALADQSKGIYDSEQVKRGDTADYLNAIEDPLAKGQGGYNAEEKAQIQMTPEQQQQMVTSAGISAGTNTAAATDAAQRATAAAGGNPAALAAYRARAASNVGAQAGDAQTKARVAASDAAAARAENIGQTRINQQSQGLNYYQSQNAQANDNAQKALGNQLTAGGLQNQAYGTETSGLNGAAQTAQAASQNPSTFDKIMGGVSGALKFLEDGDAMGGDAVIGENGPEAVVKNRYLEGGDVGSGETETEGSGLPTEGHAEVGGGGEANPRSWMQRMMERAKAGQTDPSSAPTPQSSTPTAVNSWNTVGQGAGMLAAKFLEDGSTPEEDDRGSTWKDLLIREGGKVIDSALGLPFLEDGGIAEDPMGSIVTKPTHVKLAKDEAVVPLTYRAGAKVRPSAAMPLVRSLQKRSAYRA